MLQMMCLNQKAKHAGAANDPASASIASISVVAASSLPEAKQWSQRTRAHQSRRQHHNVSAERCQQQAPAIDEAALRDSKRRGHNVRTQQHNRECTYMAVDAADPWNRVERFCNRVARRDCVKLQCTHKTKNKKEKEQQSRKNQSSSPKNKRTATPSHTSDC